MKYDLSKIMRKAWDIFRKPKYYHAKTFGEALHRAWADYKVAPTVKEIIEKAVADFGSPEILRTWYGHTQNGRMVRHEEKHVLTVEIPYPSWGDGKTKTLFFFAESQTAPIEEVA